MGSRKAELDQLLDEDDHLENGISPGYKHLTPEALLSDLPQDRLVEVLEGLLNKRPDIKESLEAELRHQEWVEKQEACWSKAPEEVTPGVAVSGTALNATHAARYIPLRLNDSERLVWNILDAALEVSEYTDKIDVYCNGSKQKRIKSEISQTCAIVSGLVVAHAYERGQKCVEKDLKENEQMYQRIFELGRRVKILNPKLMRSTYGKLMWMLMDSCKPEVQDLLDFNLVCDIQTISGLLQHKVDGDELLKDPLFQVASAEISPEGKKRSEIEEMVRRKEEALQLLKTKYGKGPQKKHPSVNDLIKSYDNPPEPSKLLTPDEVQLCVKSMADHNAFQRSCVWPCARMVALLDDYFDPTIPEPPFSLDIKHGQNGSCLTHSHSTHFQFVYQSLTLWKEIMTDLCTLWHCAEQDLMQPRYRLADTGQGLNRLQSAPSVSKTMHHILHQVQSECSQGWVGLSVVHLGDRDVPNALFFIDKYTQVPRILSPIVHCIDRIPQLEKESPALQQFIEDFGGREKLIRTILADFFRHGFDGSGDDGGSCVDGRLTSCWNWCSKIEKKKYFPVFLLTGFTGFDG